ncbi:MAG: hypothetical protein AAB643_02465 [Patescibacteria group bacterium]
MSDLVKKAILVGLGVFSLSREKTEKVIKELIKKGEEAEVDEAKFVKDILKIIEKNKEELEEKIEEIAGKVLEKMNIPTKKEVNELRDKINKLSK